jgi:hypothetical protein
VKLRPKFVTAFGILCVAVGVSWGFVDEATHFRFRFLSDDAGFFLITLAIGILLSSGGTIALARQFDKPKRLKVAGFVFFIGLVAFFVTPNNEHGPGMILGLAAICAVILSLVMAVMALAS